MIRAAALAAGALPFPACFPAPGLRMNKGALEDRGRDGADPAQFHILQIRPAVQAIWQTWDIVRRR